MFINEAFAQTTADLAATAPSATEAFVWNMGLVLILGTLFYLLLIRPQQKRFKEHSDMLSALKKGDAVVTGGGLVGKIDKVISDEELQIDLGNGLKVTALRSTIQSKNNNGLLKAANDDKSAKDEPKAAKKTTAKKTPAKKTATKKTTTKKTTAKKSTKKEAKS